MILYWVCDIIQKKNHIFWEEGNKNLTDCVTKHHPIWHHRTMRPRYLKPTKKDIENSKEQRNGTGNWCTGTNRSRVTRKSDNVLKGIRNPAPRKPDNPLNGIQNLVPNGTRNQWPRGLTIQT